MHSHQSVEMRAGSVTVADADIEYVDLIWVLGFGPRAGFLDRLQLLATLPRQNRFVTAIDALLHLHGKFRWPHLMPESYASSDPDRLASIVAQGGIWIIKPAAGSFARDVHRVESAEAALPLVREITGNGEFCLVQRYLPEVRRGEKRTLIAGDSVLGTYLRVPADGLRANLVTSAGVRPCRRTPQEDRIIEEVRNDLDRWRVGFAAIDTVGGHLMEVNVANPGGLMTLQRVYGRDHSSRAARAIIRARAPEHACVWTGAS